MDKLAKALEETYKRALRAEARTLMRWANESAKGGWSTHQVEPMRERAGLLLRLLEGDLSVIPDLEVA